MNDDIDDVIERKIENRMSQRSRSFVYLVGSAPDKKGRMRGFILGPYSDSAKATYIAERKRLTSYELFESQYSDISRVSQIIKARKLHGDSSISDTFERMKHKSIGQDDSI